MSYNLAPLSIRLLCDLGNKFSFSDINTSQVPTWVRGDDIVIETAIGFNGVILGPNLTNFASLTLQVFEEENDTNPPVMALTVLAAAMNLTLTSAAWTGNTSGNCHASFAFTGSQTSLNLDGQASSQFWMRIYATSGDVPAKTVTVLEGWVIVKDGPVSSLASPLLNGVKLVTDNGLPNVPAIYDPVTGRYYALQIDTIGGVRSLSLSDTAYS